MTDRSPNLLEMTAGIVANYLSHHRVAVTDVPGLIAIVHDALSSSPGPAPAAEEPAVSRPTAAQIRRSITDTHLISFEDGKPYKMLKRTLALRGMTMRDYREKWGLPVDYPATAPGYSASRSALAKSFGLGNLGRTAKAVTPDVGASGRVRPAARTMKPHVEPTSEPAPAAGSEDRPEATEVS